MARITTIDPPGVPSSKPLYSHTTATSSGLIFTAGQVALDEAGNTPTAYEDQLTLALANLRKCLAAAGAGPKDIVKLTYYIVNYDAARKTQQPHIPKLLEFLEGHRPCTTLVPVPKLAKPQFLFEIEATAVVEPGSSPSKALKTSTTDVDVVVVGGGLAGLEAARQVQGAGLKAVVLEARDRVGGKTWSVSTPRGSHKVDVGAAWINDSNQSRMYSMVKRFGLETVTQNTVGDAVLADSDGSVGRFAYGTSAPYPPGEKEQVIAMRDLIERICVGMDPDRPRCPDPADTLKYDSESVLDFVRREGFGRAAIDTITVWIRTMLAVEPADVSALFFLWYCRAGGGLLVMRGDKEHGGQFLRLKLGTQEFSKRLAGALKPGTVHLNTPVTAIDHTPTGVTVTTRSGETFTASRAIVTIPTPSYSWIDFKPALPPRKLALSAATTLGHAVKVLLVYPTPWWRKYGLCGLGQCCTRTGPICVVRDTSVDDDGQYALTCFAMSAPGKAWLAISDDEKQKAIVVDQIAAMYGPACALGVSTDKDSQAYKSALREVEGLIKAPTEAIWHNWSQDVWSQGCPCPVFKPGRDGKGGVLEFADELQKSVGSLHFAGTETSTVWRGYMEGAIRSGERAAEEVLSALGTDAVARL